MPLVKWPNKIITRNDLKDFPSSYFIFGDNVARTGFGGQAKEMRGEPNAIGIVTKWRPDNSWKSFFDDSLECFELLCDDLNKVENLLNNRTLVWYPRNGIGTGLAALPFKAPKLYRYLNKWIKKHENLL